MILVKLFLVFFRIGIFAVGGAYSFLPLIEKEAVKRYSWLTKNEFLDVLGMTKIFPGAISIKFATYTGYKLAGIPGVIAANTGNFLAPALIILFASFFYMKHKDNPSLKAAFSLIQMVVFAMIISLAFQLIDVKLIAQPRNLFIVLSCLALFSFTRVHPGLVIILAGALGVLLR